MKEEVRAGLREIGEGGGGNGSWRGGYLYGSVSFSEQLRNVMFLSAVLKHGGTVS